MIDSLQHNRWAVADTEFAIRVIVPDLKGFFDNLPVIGTAPKTRSLPKVRLTGHCSFAGDGTLRRGDELFLANLPRYAAGETLVNEVDLAVFLETLR